MKNNKKKISLIALLSCVIVVSIAFAAYSGILKINGKADIMANPFKMIFVDSSGSEVLTIPTSSTTGSAEATNLTVSSEKTEIPSFNVKLYKINDAAEYTFKIKNTGGSTAYLENIKIAATDKKELSALSGLKYSFTIGSTVDFVATSSAGAQADVAPDGTSGKNYISVDAGDTVDCKLLVAAESDALFNGSSNVNLTLGTIQINWTSVNPNTSA